MSFEASGTVAGFLTFSKRRSGQQARWQRKQSVAPSSEQETQQAKFLNASIACRFFGYGLASYGALIYGSEKSLFDDEAGSKNLTGYNLCIQEFLSN